MRIWFKLLILVATIFLIGGFVIVGRGINSIFTANKAADWPTVKGTMNACEIEKIRDSAGTIYQLHLDYSYEVSGENYHGNRLAFGYSESRRYDEHLLLYNKLSMAKTVLVRYNPVNPSESVLTYGVSQYTVNRMVKFFVLFFIIVCILCGLLIFKTDMTEIDRIEILEEKC